MSESHRHSELVGVTGARGTARAEVCKGEWWNRRKAGVTPRDTGPQDRGQLQLL